jgi:REP element-mobilizing transposase RayT
MARIARVVVPGVPHHVTQRGNRREITFFGDADYRLYRDLLGAAAAKARAEIWAYCLMPNHVHVIVTPKGEDGLRRTFGDLHRRYTAHVNARNQWTGHLWQARFSSVAMDEDHLIAAIRDVSLNPVRARLVDPSRRLAVVQRTRASARPGWWRGDDRAPTFPGGTVRRFSRRGFRRGQRLRSLAPLGDHRPPGRIARLDQAPCACSRPPARAAQAQPKAARS